MEAIQNLASLQNSLPSSIPTTSGLPSLPTPSINSTIGTETQSPSSNGSPTVSGSDSITCGQCSLKFFHVTQFLKHKSSCPGNNTEDGKVEGKLTLKIRQ